jgi:hypothetical protein
MPKHYRPEIAARCAPAAQLARTTEDGLSLTAFERSRVDAALASGDTCGLTLRELRAMARSVRWVR